MTLTTSKKKSTCGLLCTKNLTGCLSMTTCAKKETKGPHSCRYGAHLQRVFGHVDASLNALTLRIKSGGVPGLTVGLRTPSWWEWIRVSSRSRTRIFLFTASRVDGETHQAHYSVHLHAHEELAQTCVCMQQVGNHNFIFKPWLIMSVWSLSRSCCPV